MIKNKREKNIEIFKEIQYLVDNDPTVIKATSYSLHDSILYLESDLPEGNEIRSRDTQIVINTEDTISSVISLKESEEKGLTACLNFASAKTPGEEYLKDLLLKKKIYVGLQIYTV